MALMYLVLDNGKVINMKVNGKTTRKLGKESTRKNFKILSNLILN